MSRNFQQSQEFFHQERQMENHLEALAHDFQRQQETKGITCFKVQGYHPKLMKSMTFNVIAPNAEDARRKAQSAGMGKIYTTNELENVIY